MFLWALLQGQFHPYSKNKIPFALLSPLPTSNHLFIFHTCEPSGGRFWGSLPSTFKIFCPWKKSSTKKSGPTFCDQYFWKFPIWNSRADEKRREIQMVKVNVIFNDIWLLICLTPLQVNWVMVIIQQLSTDWQLIGDKGVCLWHTFRWLELW